MVTPTYLGVSIEEFNSLPGDVEDDLGNFAHVPSGSLRGRVRVEYKACHSQLTACMGLREVSHDLTLSLRQASSVD